MSGNVKKYTKNKGFESINRDMLQDVDNLSLQAIGLLANLTSYPDGWTVHKTELYKRFAKSGRRVVERAWGELIENNYIVQLRKRNGKKYDYIYYHSQVPFTDDNIKDIEITEGVPVWDGKISKTSNSNVSSTVQNEQSNKKSGSTVQNEQSKLNSTKRTDNKLTIKEINYKDLDTLDTKRDLLQINKNEKLKEEYIKKAFFENSDKVPLELGKAFEVFCRSTEEAEQYYKSINQAKLDVFKNAMDYKNITLFSLIHIDNEPELLQVIINVFVRVIRKVEKERNIDNPSGYLYKSVYKQVWDYFNLDSLQSADEYGM